MVNQLLAISSLELQQMVRAELEQNPALESVESITCTQCGAGTTGKFCPVCTQPVSPVAAPGTQDPLVGNGKALDDDFDLEDFRPRNMRTDFAEEEFDPFTLVASLASMPDELIGDLMASLPHEDHSIAKYLVGNLDDQGFLRCSAEAAARELSVPLEQVERVLKVLQSTGPVGVGARNLSECLLMQLKDLKEQGIVGEIPLYVEEVITNHLKELGEHKYTAIAHALGITHDDVVAIHDFIKVHLQPRPLQDAAQARTWRSPSSTNFVVPDVIIREREGQLEAEVVEKYRFSLRMNPLYQRLAAETKNKVENSMSQGDRDHIRRYVNQAKLFISSINQRHETLLRVTNCLIQLQEDFIRYGVRWLKPLTRAQVAQYISLHESTVSRATADKYLMLPDKRVIPFSDFFSASLSIKDVIKELVTKEARPMTDNEIVQRLEEQGIRIARRTVAKYRNQLGIMPSTLR
jgi:RNA polymerase sigma-54 factor